MNVNEIATKADIEVVLNALAKLESLLCKADLEQKFLRSSDVRKILNISDGTLQRLRITRTLNAKKVNGTWFYTLNDIQKLITNKNEND